MGISNKDLNHPGNKIVLDKREEEIIDKKRQSLIREKNQDIGCQKYKREDIHAGDNKTVLKENSKKGKHYKRRNKREDFHIRENNTILKENSKEGKHYKKSSREHLKLACKSISSSSSQYQQEENKDLKVLNKQPKGSNTSSKDYLVKEGSRINDTSRHLVNLEQAFNQEIFKLKLKQHRLKMELKLERDLEILEQKSSTLWADKLANNKREYLRKNKTELDTIEPEVVVKHYSKEHKCVCTSPRYANNEDFAMRPKTRTIASQIMTDRGALGDHKSDVVLERNDYGKTEKNIGNLYKESIQPVIQETIANCCYCYSNCERFNTCTGWPHCNKHYHQATGIRTCNPYFYSESYGEPNCCCSHPNHKTCADVKGNHEENYVSNYGRQTTDLNTQYFYHRTNEKSFVRSSSKRYSKQPLNSKNSSQCIYEGSSRETSPSSLYKIPREDNDITAKEYRRRKPETEKEHKHNFEKYALREERDSRNNKEMMENIIKNNNGNESKEAYLLIKKRDYKEKNKRKSSKENNKEVKETNEEHFNRRAREISHQNVEKNKRQSSKENNKDVKESISIAREIPHQNFERDQDRSKYNEEFILNKKRDYKSSKEKFKEAKDPREEQFYSRLRETRDEHKEKIFKRDRNRSRSSHKRGKNLMQHLENKSISKLVQLIDRYTDDMDAKRKKLGESKKNDLDEYYLNGSYKVQNQQKSYEIIIRKSELKTTMDTAQFYNSLEHTKDPEYSLETLNMMKNMKITKYKSIKPMNDDVIKEKIDMFRKEEKASKYEEYVRQYQLDRTLRTKESKESQADSHRTYTTYEDESYQQHKCTLEPLNSHTNITNSNTNQYIHPKSGEEFQNYCGNPQQEFLPSYQEETKKVPQQFERQNSKLIEIDKFEEDSDHFKGSKVEQCGEVCYISPKDNNMKKLESPKSVKLQEKAEWKADRPDNWKDLRDTTEQYSSIILETENKQEEDFISKTERFDHNINNTQINPVLREYGIASETNKDYYRPRSNENFIEKYPRNPKDPKNSQENVLNPSNIQKPSAYQSAEYSSREYAIPMSTQNFIEKYPINPKDPKNSQENVLNPSNIQNPSAYQSAEYSSREYAIPNRENNQRIVTKILSETKTDCYRLEPKQRLVEKYEFLSKQEKKLKRNEEDMPHIKPTYDRAEYSIQNEENHESIQKEMFSKTSRDYYRVVPDENFLEKEEYHPTLENKSLKTQVKQSSKDHKDMIYKKNEQKSLVYKGADFTAEQYSVREENFLKYKIANQESPMNPEDFIGIDIASDNMARLVLDENSFEKDEYHPILENKSFKTQVKHPDEDQDKYLKDQQNQKCKSEIFQYIQQKEANETKDYTYHDDGMYPKYSLNAVLNHPLQKEALASELETNSQFTNSSSYEAFKLAMDNELELFNNQGLQSTEIKEDRILEHHDKYITEDVLRTATPLRLIRRESSSISRARSSSPNTVNALRSLKYFLRFYENESLEGEELGELAMELMRKLSHNKVTKRCTDQQPRNIPKNLVPSEHSVTSKQTFETPWIKEKEISGDVSRNILKNSDSEEEHVKASLELQFIKETGKSEDVLRNISKNTVTTADVPRIILKESVSSEHTLKDQQTFLIKEKERPVCVPRNILKDSGSEEQFIKETGKSEDVPSNIHKYSDSEEEHALTAQQSLELQFIKETVKSEDVLRNIPKNSVMTEHSLSGQQILGRQWIKDKGMSEDARRNILKDSASSKHTLKGQQTFLIKETERPDCVPRNILKDSDSEEQGLTAQQSLETQMIKETVDVSGNILKNSDSEEHALTVQQMIKETEDVSGNILKDAVSSEHTLKDQQKLETKRIKEKERPDGIPRHIINDSFSDDLVKKEDIYDIVSIDKLISHQNESNNNKKNTENPNIYKKIDADTSSNPHHTETAPYNVIKPKNFDQSFNQDTRKIIHTNLPKTEIMTDIDISASKHEPNDLVSNVNYSSNSSINIRYKKEPLHSISNKEIDKNCLGICHQESETLNLPKKSEEMKEFTSEEPINSQAINKNWSFPENTIKLNQYKSHSKLGKEPLNTIPIQTSRECLNNEAFINQSNEDIQLYKEHSEHVTDPNEHIEENTIPNEFFYDQSQSTSFPKFVYQGQEDCLHKNQTTLKGILKQCPCSTDNLMSDNGNIEEQKHSANNISRGMSEAMDLDKIDKTCEEREDEYVTLNINNNGAYQYRQDTQTQCHQTSLRNNFECLPPFAHCRCMMETYLNITKIYNKW